MQNPPFLIPTLETARLRLRPLRFDDGARVLELASAPEVAATGRELPQGRVGDAAKAWIGGQAQLANSGRAVVCAVADRHDDVIGVVGLQVALEHARAELAYWVGVPFWGQGFASEAAAAMRDWGFDQVGLHRLHATSLASNRASTRVMEKIGMRREGRLRGHLRKPNGFVDLVTYGMLAGDPRPA